MTVQGPVKKQQPDGMSRGGGGGGACCLHAEGGVRSAIFRKFPQFIAVFLRLPLELHQRMAPKALARSSAAPSAGPGPVRWRTAAFVLGVCSCAAHEATPCESHATVVSAPCEGGRAGHGVAVDPVHSWS